MTLPSNVQTRMVTWAAMDAVIDSADPDRDPDGVPIEGVKVNFAASIQQAKNVSATPPVTIFFSQIQALTDATGQLVSPDGQVGVFLICTDDTDLQPVNWTWTATISVPNFKTYTVTFALPQGSGSVDLTTLFPVPPDPGQSLDDWLQAVAETQANADAAAASASAAAASAAEAQPPVFHSRAELNAIRTPGVGIYTTTSLQADFPEIASSDNENLPLLVGASAVVETYYLNDGFAPTYRTILRFPSYGVIDMQYTPKYDSYFVEVQGDIQTAGLDTYITPTYQPISGSVGGISVFTGTVVEVATGANVTINTISNLGTNAPGSQVTVIVLGTATVQGASRVAGTYLLTRQTSTWNLAKLGA
jgi:hypothetical protein